MTTAMIMKASATQWITEVFPLFLVSLNFAFRRRLAGPRSVIIMSLDSCGCEGWARPDGSVRGLDVL